MVKDILNEEYYYHKYDVNIISLYFLIEEKTKSLTNLDSVRKNTITNRIKNIIKFLIDSNNYDSSVLFKHKIPYIVYSEDLSFSLFLALKILYEDLI